MLVISHHGAGHSAPANTRESFERAVTLGAEWIELDVVKVGEELFVIHGPRLEDSTDGRGLVWDASPSELRTLTVRGTEERIPTLSEALDTIGLHANVNIDMKWWGAGEAVAQFLADEQARGRRLPEILVSSFNHLEVLEFRSRLPALDTAAIFYGVPTDLAAQIARIGCKYIVVAVEFLSRAIVQQADAAGAGVIAYTIQNSTEAQRFADLGIAGFVTDSIDDPAIRGQKRAGR